MQADIDTWHQVRIGQPHDADAYAAFLKRIGCALCAPIVSSLCPGHELLYGWMDVSEVAVTRVIYFDFIERRGGRSQVHRAAGPELQDIAGRNGRRGVQRRRTTGACSVMPAECGALFIYCFCSLWCL